MGISRPLLILGLVVAEVGLWQWRMVIAARGRRALAMLLGTLGATLQITAISQVVTNLDEVLSIMAYAAGVGVGVVAGLVVGDLVTPGTIGVTVITRSPGLAEGLWLRGWPATVQSGLGQDGPVDIVHVPINRRHETALQEDVALLASDASWTAVERTSAKITQVARG